MGNLTRLLFGEKGLTDLEGNVVQANPVGEPILLTIARDRNEFDRERLELPSSISDQEILERELKKCSPRNADCYVLGEEKFPIIHEFLLGEVGGDYFAYTVQYYRKS
jgi:hypothetical protein